MSVYTQLDQSDIKSLLANYNIGSYQSHAGIVSGTVNTNYFVTTEQQETVLTLFETLSQTSDILFYLNLQRFLAAHNVPCPAPIADKQMNTVQHIKDKPAVLFPKINGQSLDQVRPEHCKQVARAIANMHKQTAHYPEQMQNSMGLAWRDATIDKLQATLTPSQATLLNQALTIQNETDYSACPRGIIHADVFRDNVFFEDDNLSGIIDFYFACHDIFLFDLAVLYNDWCFDDQHFLADNARAVFDSYQNVRLLSDEEKRLWPQALQAWTLRFWLSRLIAKVEKSASADVLIKDPEFYEERLRLHLNAAHHYFD